MILSTNYKRNKNLEDWGLRHEKTVRVRGLAGRIRACSDNMIKDLDSICPRFHQQEQPVGDANSIVTLLVAYYVLLVLSTFVLYASARS